ncbi:MAG: hypothetical protein ACTSU5_12190 [Promethearchaeota archaeon]
MRREIRDLMRRQIHLQKGGQTGGSEKTAEPGSRGKRKAAKKKGGKRKKTPDRGTPSPVGGSGSSVEIDIDGIARQIEERILKKVGVDAERGEKSGTSREEIMEIERQLAVVRKMQSEMEDRIAELSQRNTTLETEMKELRRAIVSLKK